MTRRHLLAQAERAAMHVDLGALEEYGGASGRTALSTPFAPALPTLREDSRRLLREDDDRGPLSVGQAVAKMRVELDKLHPDDRVPVLREAIEKAEVLAPPAEPTTVRVHDPDERAAVAELERRRERPVPGAVLRGDPKGMRVGKQLADAAVASYFLACDSALSQARGKSVGLDGFTARDATRQAKRVWALLSQARVFVVDPFDYAKAYRRADEHTCALAGLPWDGDSSPEEARHLYAVYRDESGRVPFPEPLPFDAVFFGYGRQFALSEVQMSCRFSNDVEGLGITGALLLGHVLGVSGDTREAYAVVDIQARGYSGVGFVATYSNQKDLPGLGLPDWPSDWLQPANLDPWVLPALVDAVNDRKHLTVEQPGLAAKMARKRAMKLGKTGAPLPLPAPYYVVRVADHVEQAQAARIAQAAPRSVSYSHRFDVRGHDCVRVAKGKLPIDSETSVRLRKRGYAIYDVQPVAQAHADLLGKRGVARGPDEWVAVLVYHREAYVKGDADKPYVPAARVLA